MTEERDATSTRSAHEDTSQMALPDPRLPHNLICVCRKFQEEQVFQGGACAWYKSHEMQSSMRKS